MKNAAISAFSVILIAIYTLFSSIYINQFAGKIEAEIEYADQNGYTLSVTDSLQKTLDSNMAVLLLITNRDHIGVIEECIVNIRYSTEYSDIMNINIYRDLLINTLKEISRLNTIPI